MPTWKSPQDIGREGSAPRRGHCLGHYHRDRSSWGDAGGGSHHRHHHQCARRSGWCSSSSNPGSGFSSWLMMRVMWSSRRSNCSHLPCAKREGRRVLGGVVDGGLLLLPLRPVSIRFLRVVSGTGTGQTTAYLCGGHTYNLCRYGLTKSPMNLRAPLVSPPVLEERDEQVEPPEMRLVKRLARLERLEMEALVLAGRGTSGRW